MNKIKLNMDSIEEENYPLYLNCVETIMKKYYDLEVDTEIALKSTLITLEELLGSAIYGYDYDADREIPFYEGCIKIVKERLKNEGYSLNDENTKD